MKWNTGGFNDFQGLKGIPNGRVQIIYDHVNA